MILQTSADQFPSPFKTNKKKKTDLEEYLYDWSMDKFGPDIIHHFQAKSHGRFCWYFVKITASYSWPTVLSDFYQNKGKKVCA